jgi:hypothetical protein
MEFVKNGVDTAAGQIQDLQAHPEPYVSASQLARYWRVSVKHLHKLLEMGILTGVRLGPRLLRVRTADAIRFEHLAKTATQNVEHR